jgi:hypothetical protein
MAMRVSVSSPYSLSLLFFGGMVPAAAARGAAPH